MDNTVSQHSYFLTLPVKENSLLEVLSMRCERFKTSELCEGLGHWNSILLLACLCFNFMGMCSIGSL